MSIRKKITLWFSLLVAILFAVFCIVLYQFMSNSMNQKINEQMYLKSDEVIRQIAVYPSTLFFNEVVLPDVDVFINPGIYLQLLDDQYRIISRSSNLGNQHIPLSNQAYDKTKAGQSYIEDIHGKDQAIRILYRPIMVEKKQVGVLQVAISLSSYLYTMNELRFILITSSLMAVIVIALIGWFMAKKVLAPIEQINRTTKEITSHSDLQRRIPYEGPQDEIGILIENINTMLARLENIYNELNQSYLLQKRFVADASHELRTPLTSIRGNVELLQRLGAGNEELKREIVQDIEDEATRMSRLIHDLLALARADAGFKMEMEWVDLAALFEDLKKHVHHFSKEGVQFTTQLSLFTTQLWGNHDYLRQLIIILLDNAFKYTERGEVSLKASEDEQHFYVQVQDTGIGMTADELAHAKERFYRSDLARQRTGVGLGLAIATWIAQEHSAKMELTSEPKVGTCVSLIFDK